MDGIYKRAAEMGLSWLNADKKTVNMKLVGGLEVLIQYQYACVMRNVLNKKNKEERRPLPTDLSMPFLVAYSKFLEHAQERVLDDDLVQEFMVSMAMTIFCVKGNCIMPKANATQGRAFPRLLEAYEIALDLQSHRN